LATRRLLLYLVARVLALYTLMDDVTALECVIEPRPVMSRHVMYSVQPPA